MANILTCYYRPKPGGLCKRLFRAINALLAEGHTVHYLSVVPFPIKHPNCHFHAFPWPKQNTENILFWGIFHILSPLMLLIIGYKYKITHVFSFGHTYSFLMQPLHLIKNIPQALFLRADTIKNHQLKDRHFFLIALERFFEGLAVCNVNLYGVSKTLTQKVCSRHSLLKPKKTGILTNDIKTLPEINLKKKYNLPIRLACVGILEKRKNQKLLLDVMEKIKPEQARLFIYGIGPQEEELRRLAKNKGLTGKIFFMGWTEPEQIWENIDLLLMPSLHEGAPNAVLEAFENGLPVIASNIPEHLEILPFNNLLPSKSIKKWQQKIINICNSPETELCKIRKKQHSYAMQLLFNWDKEVCYRILSKEFKLNGTNW